MLNTTMLNTLKRFAISTLAATVGYAATASADVPAVLDTYADIAHAGYEDSVTTARALQKAVDVLLAAPSAQTLAKAREAWVAARVPYQQTEVYRFGNALVDDWEGKVNAWPLDEGLIDYVETGTYGTESDENDAYTANVIAHAAIKVGGDTIDARAITKRLIGEHLHEAGGVEANVASGYHAIEFLLWGQDLNGTGPGAGNRPHTDFDTAHCTGGNCDRRGEYLKQATALLIDDLEEMVGAWAPGGAARTAVTDAGEPGLVNIITGMGSLSYGELAGERMKLGLMLHDPEEEHDCFSDNTHASHFYDAKGIRNVYLGRYERVGGGVVTGPSLSGLVAARSKALDAELKTNLDATMTAMGALVRSAENGEAYDQMIGEGNAAGNAKVQAAIDALVMQTRSIERAVASLGLASIAFEGSDSLDAPEKVFE